MEGITEGSLELHLPHLVLLTAVAAATCAFFFLLRKTISGGQTTVDKWPPGPPAWPLIGHLHLLGHLPHHSLCTLSQRYGPLLGLRLGGVSTIVASSPDMAKQILQTHDLAFAYRPRSTAALHMFFDCTNIGGSPYGPYWKLMRQLCASELFNTKRLEAFRHVREEEAQALALSLLQSGRQGEKQVVLRPSLLATSNNINCRMAMGKRITEISGRMGCNEDSKLDLVSLIEEVMYLLSVFYVGDFIPWLGWLDPNGYLKRMKAAGQRLNALMQDFIDKRREEGPPGHTPPDLLDVLLAASHNKDLGIKITDDNIKAVILDVFAGGSHTSSVTVEWALAELINNPRVMHKLQEELDHVVGRARLVQEGDIENLPYLGSVLKESMRLHPATPLLIPHENNKELQIGGYKILAKSRALVNTWAIGRDAASWESPLDFRPERFDDRNLDFRGQNFELLPFGSGRRRCPGWALGLLNVHLMLATLVQSFTWSARSSTSSNDGSHIHSVDMSERFGLAVTMAKPLCAFATPRMPLHLF